MSQTLGEIGNVAKEKCGGVLGDPVTQSVVSLLFIKLKSFRCCVSVLRGAQVETHGKSINILARNQSGLGFRGL